MEPTSQTVKELDESNEIANIKKIEAALFLSARYLSLKELVLLTDINPLMLKDLLEKLIQKEYNYKDYSFCADQECGNDSQHSFNVELNAVSYYERTEMLSGCFTTGSILNDLCDRGIIKKGKYLIKVCW